MGTRLTRLLVSTALVALAAAPAAADQVFTQAVIVQDSACIGIDCVNGENFGFNTLVLKENNLRLFFNDTSTTAGFASTDWILEANASGNGGTNHFAIVDNTAGRTPFKIEASAPTNALFVDDGGRIGFGTSTPVVENHIKDGDTPTVRLEQDGTSGFTAQTWDVAGNETNFFVRDATNGSVLPFKIQPSAPNNALFIASSGSIGFGTTSPQRSLHSVAADTPALRLEQTGSGFDAQSWDLAANETNFFIRDATGGTIPFRVRPGAPSNAFLVDADGEVGIGTSSPLGGLHVRGFVAYSTSNITRGQLLVENRHPSDTIMLNVTNDGAITNVWRNNDSGTRWVEVFGTDTDGKDAWSLSTSGNATAISVTSGGNVTIAGILSQGSSRAIKTDFQAVAPQDVLERVAGLPIVRWSYKSDATGSDHLGPMAEDFYAAFGLGRDAQHLSASDSAGVALASTQALYEKMKVQQAELDELRQANRKLQSQLESLLDAQQH